jgi:hypothetical protein
MEQVVHNLIYKKTRGKKRKIMTSVQLDGAH